MKEIESIKELFNEFILGVEEVFVDVKSKPVAGWYVDSIQPKWMMFIKDGIMHYGFNTNGEWKNVNGSYAFTDNDYPADPKEVESRLIELLKNKYPQFKHFSYHTDNRYGMLYLGFGWNGNEQSTELINNGKFIDITPEPLTINGKPVEIQPKGVIIGDRTNSVYQSFDDLRCLKADMKDLGFDTVELDNLLTKIECDESAN